MKYILALSFLFFLTPDIDAQRIRRLLLFANDTANVQLITQRTWLENEKAGVEDRDIWLAIFHDPKTFRRMYEHYDVGRADFMIILIGKDGTEKLRSYEPVTAEALFDLIDSMPMRQAELRARGG